LFEAFTFFAAVFADFAFNYPDKGEEEDLVSYKAKD
jgi:hypothetical protein